MNSPHETAPKRSTLGRTLLIVSLAANLFLAGLLAGGWISGFRLHGPGALSMMRPAGDIDSKIRRLARQLPDETRAKLHQAMDEVRPDARDIMRDRFQAHRAVMQALTAEPFDADQLAAAFNVARAADHTHRELSHHVVVTFLQSLDGQERAFVVRMLGENFNGMSRRDGPPGGPKGPRRSGFDDMPPRLPDASGLDDAGED